MAKQPRQQNREEKNVIKIQTWSQFLQVKLTQIQWEQWRKSVCVRGK